MSGNKKRKTAAAILLTGALAFGSVSTSFAGVIGHGISIGKWQQDSNGWWYQYYNSYYVFGNIGHSESGSSLTHILFFGI